MLNRQQQNNLANKAVAGCALVIVVWVLLGHASPAGEPAITTGSATGARDYYVRISKELKLDAKPGITTLDDLLDFTGYSIPGAKLESLEPGILMNPERASSASDGLGLQLRG